jgi:hypothetical protein
MTPQTITDTDGSGSKGDSADVDDFPLLARFDPDLASAQRADSPAPTSDDEQLDHEITICFGEYAADACPMPRTLSLRQLIDEFSAPDTARGNLSSLEYHALDPAIKEQKQLKQREKDGQYFVVGTFSGDGRRLKENIQRLQGFALDFDSGKTTKIMIEARLAGYIYVAYTSYSHREGHEKWRVFIPYSDPITPEQHAAIYSHFQGVFDGDLDPHCENPSQLWYTPACPNDAEGDYQCFHRLGNLFDAGTVKATPTNDADLSRKDVSQSVPLDSTFESHRLEDALQHIPADDRKVWIDVGLAIKHDLGEAGLPIWLAWSQKSKKFDLNDALATWESFKPKDMASPITLGSVYHLAKENGWTGFADSAETPDYIARLNETYFLALDGGKSLVFRESVDPQFQRRRLDAMRPGDFQVYFANEFVVVMGQDGKPKKVNIAKAWIEHPKRRDYEGLILAPNNDVPGYYNLWRGFAVQPKPGNWDRMKVHIKKILCRGDRKAYTYLLNWLAFGVQNPNKTAEVAVVMRGARGTGKGILARTYGKLFGQHFVHISHAKHLTGNFNAHLRDCIVLFVDEALWAGDKPGEGELKRLVTEPTLRIEPKFRDSTETPNMLHILMASNNEWVVPAGIDERRFFVLDVDESKKQNSAYFEALQRELDNGGLQAMLYDLQKQDLSKFDIRKVPNTQALMDQKILSLDPVEQWWFEKLINGTLVLPQNGQDVWAWVPKTALHDDYVSHVKTVGVSRRATETGLGMKLRSLLPDGYPKSGRITKEEDAGFGRRMLVYRFPPLETCRTHFEEAMKLENFDWNWDKKPNKNK